MKIIHIIFSLQIGGSESMLIDIINEQVKTDSVSLWIVNKGINDDLFNKIDSRINVVRFNRTPSGRNPLPLIKLNYFLFRFKPDIIHFHNHKGVLLLLPSLKNKAVLTIHAAKIQSRFFVKYQKLFAISKAVRDDIRVRYGLNADVVYNGIETSKVKRKNPQEENPVFRMVQVSRLNHLQKGQHLLIEAMKRLVYEHKLTHIQLDFIGEGDSLVFLKQLVNDYHLENQITFAGLKDRSYIYFHLPDYDLLVQPSLNEGFGLTIIEAMAAKVPVLVSDIEGPMEAIDYGQGGYYFKTGNVNDLTQKIEDIMTNYNAESNIQMIENAYQYVINRFDVKQTAANYIQKYGELSSNTHR